MFRRLLPILLLPLTASSAAPPARYDVEATLASVPATGGPTFGTRFLFAPGNQVIYRLVPANRSDTDPATRWEFFSPSGSLGILPVTGYESVDVTALNAGGEAVGRSVSESAPGPDPHQECALFWTPAGGSTRPDGFDAGSSGLKAINAAHLAGGFSNGGTYLLTRGNPADPANLQTIDPAGYANAEIRGISSGGEALLFVGGSTRAALWSGTTISLLDPAPAAGETFYPANCAMNARGDVAMLFFTAAGNSRLVYAPAANRAGYQVFTFNGPVTSVYNLQISDAGFASFDTSVNGTNVVNVVSTDRGQQFTFTGYRSFLNARGELVFGDGGKLNYWDAAAWSGSPAVIPLRLPAAPAAPEIVGFNDDGRLLTLSYDAAQTTRTLSILAPAQPTPPAAATLSLTPVRSPLRLTTGTAVRRMLVRGHSSGDPGAVRYLVRGKLPAGLRLRASDGWLLGRPTRAQRKVVRITATYSSDGAVAETPAVRITILVRVPASPPTQ